MLPLLVWLIVAVVRKELASITRMSKGLDAHPADRPQAIAADGLPDETTPFVQAINWMLARVDALIERFPVLARRKPRIHDLLERYDALFIRSLRFHYGPRIEGPVIMGSSRIPLLRFAVLNVVGAALWAALIAGAEYTFGAAIETVLVDLKTIEEAALVVILVLGFGVWLWRRSRAKRLHRNDVG